MSYANNNEINKVWLYAYNTGDEDGIVAFCNSAWENGWLLRLAKRYEILWQCDNPDPCTFCDWAANKGTWHVVSQFLLGQQYFAY